MGLKGLFSSGASTLVENVGEAIDRNITSDEERLKLKVELDKIHNDYEGELTKRLQADAQSDSWYSWKISLRCREGLSGNHKRYRWFWFALQSRKRRD